MRHEDEDDEALGLCPEGGGLMLLECCLSCGHENEDTEDS